MESALSRDRLSRFVVVVGEPSWEALARYAWNVALCEAFYPLLHAFEVVLRNRLFELGESTFHYQRVQHVACWLDADPSPLHAHGRMDVAKAKQLLRMPGVGSAAAARRPLTPGDLVAALDFGFWTALFKRHYLYQSARDPRLWPHGLPRVFPQATARLDFKTIATRVNDLRHLRNRIFHHEPIWRRPNLTDDAADLLELLDWMSPEVGRMLRRTERLTTVLSDD
ncbi:MAG TPA: hypothetical protein VFQ39_04425, partial [Longimicrobium sp.]|nr:hypothetical protein [Longimicrobium sp.]